MLPAPWRGPGEGRWSGLRGRARTLCPWPLEQKPLRCAARPPCAALQGLPPRSPRSHSSTAEARGRPGPSEARALFGCRGPEGCPSQAGGAPRPEPSASVYTAGRTPAARLSPRHTGTPLKPPFRERSVSQSSAFAAGHLAQTIRGSLSLHSFHRKHQTPGRRAANQPEPAAAPGPTRSCPLGPGGGTAATLPTRPRYPSALRLTVDPNNPYSVE